MTELEVGNRIAALRNEKDITQMQLAEDKIQQELRRLIRIMLQNKLKRYNHLES